MLLRTEEGETFLSKFLMFGSLLSEILDPPLQAGQNSAFTKSLIYAIHVITEIRYNIIVWPINTHRCCNISIIS